jgi:hypothetical protein
MELYSDFYLNSDSAAGSNCDVDMNLEIKLTRRGCCGPGGSVGIATDYGTVRVSNPAGGRDFSHTSRPALGPTQPVRWVQGVSRV